MRSNRSTMLESVCEVLVVIFPGGYVVIFKAKMVRILIVLLVIDMIQGFQRDGWVVHSGGEAHQ